LDGNHRFAFGGDHLHGKFDAQSYGGRLEGGYRVATPFLRVTPYAALQSQRFHTPTFTEADLTGGGFALTFASRHSTDTRSELGARFDKVMSMPGSPAWTLGGRLAWAHDWVSNPSLAAVFRRCPARGSR
jgi:outer membrane autotransporter protein